MTPVRSLNHTGGAGVTVDTRTDMAPPLLAEGWLRAWESLGGNVTIGPGGRTLNPWINFGADRAAPGIAAHLMDELHDTPGLPRAISYVISKRIGSR